ncbi:hypothetical protein BJ508DRAFT_48271 [Ascobolus immersus RN42]|uniref:Uncharacterized protein n=1 Tax=Ascobolus immersus RN42 TaxID=1160509 RepID=A0A3N4HL35_ASCIM|nr:hypothetical protein BJ508DRAFT_48271 [Ascobolus immersus RN42]
MVHFFSLFVLLATPITQLSFASPVIYADSSYGSGVNTSLASGSIAQSGAGYDDYFGALDTICKQLRQVQPVPKVNESRDPDKARKLDAVCNITNSLEWETVNSKDWIEGNKFKIVSDNLFGSLGNKVGKAGIAVISVLSVVVSVCLGLLVLGWMHKKQSQSEVSGGSGTDDDGDEEGGRRTVLDAIGNGGGNNGGSCYSLGWGDSNGDCCSSCFGSCGSLLTGCCD